MTSYDTFIFPRGATNNISYKAAPDRKIANLQYPDKDQTNVFGPLYLPRVYGMDLTAFEIASSGSVAVSLSDVYSFDLKRDASSNIQYSNCQHGS